MSDDRGAAPPPPPSRPGTPEEPMVGGGIYFRWNDRLWQEQADGSYLLWDEDARRWETSTLQPPPQPGQTLTTRECPNCGRRVKATLRYCPYCEYGFEGPGTPAPKQEAAPAAAPRAKRDVSTAVLIATLVVAIAAGAFVFQHRRAQACDNWRAAVQELTDATVELQGLPRGATEDDLYQQNESLLADRRPGGCE